MKIYGYRLNGDFYGTNKSFGIVISKTEEDAVRLINKELGINISREQISLFFKTDKLHNSVFPYFIFEDYKEDEN